MKRVTYDLKENEIERELTIYLSQYIHQMYRDYLDRKKMEKGYDTKIKINNVNDLNGDLTMDMHEESKEDKSAALKTGDKYIIRKLVSLKITPDQIQDFINMLIAGSNSMSSSNCYPQMNYAGYPPNMNQFGYDNGQQMMIPQSNNPHARSNS